jgi:hypothetical protein
VSNVDIAVIVAAPTATPVTRPAGDTVAIAAFEVVHVTVVGAPLTTVTFAASCTAAPTTTVGLAGVTTTETTAGGGGFTVTATVADFVASATDVAVTFALPAATPVITPVLLTETIAAFELLHVTAVEAPPTTATVAVSGVLWPTTTDGAAGVIVTETTAGRGLTVIAAVAVFVASNVDVAVIVAFPTATACT